MNQGWLAWTGRGGAPQPPEPAPSVPLGNLYYLLCYARNRLEARDLVDVGAIEGASPAVLLAEILDGGLRRLRLRGLPRDYRLRHEDTSAPRGRIELGPSIGRGLLQRQQVQCAVDELTSDLPYNQVLKAALRSLARSPEVDRSRRHRLRQHVVALGQVADVRLEARLLRVAGAGRLDGLRSLLLLVCELVWLGGLPQRQEGGQPFVDLFSSAQILGRLFEDFLAGWLAREQSAFGVAKRQVGWAVEACAGDRGLLPTMEGDVLLSRGDRRVLLEAKAYSRTLDGRHGSSKVRSDHLYQLLSYLVNLAEDGGPPVTGVLVYVRSEVALDLRYRLAGHPVQVRTLDLERPWTEIHGTLAGWVRDWAHSEPKPAWYLEPEVSTE